MTSTQITTTRIRARGSAISSFFNWMCVFAVVEMTPPAIANIGWRVFIIFAVFNALWVPLVYAFFPETKGLELEDVDHIFEKGGVIGYAHNEIHVSGSAWAGSHSSASTKPRMP